MTTFWSARESGSHRIGCYNPELQTSAPLALRHCPPLYPFANRMSNKIKLYCWILGNDPSKVFPVQIEKT